jgi:hypothetical protein
MGVVMSEFAQPRLMLENTGKVGILGRVESGLRLPHLN